VLDAYIVNHSDLPFDVRRLPIAQMGCHAGATALAQAYQYLQGDHRKGNVLICCIELCSLNEQPLDEEASMFVSRGLFGDGASACVVRGDAQGCGLRLLDTQQFLVPDTIEHMQYDLDEWGNHFATRREVIAGL